MTSKHYALVIVCNKSHEIYLQMHLKTHLKMYLKTNQKMYLKTNLKMYLKTHLEHRNKALFTNDVYKPYHHPILQIMMLVDGTVQGVLQSMIVDENL